MLWDLSLKKWVLKLIKNLEIGVRKVLKIDAESMKKVANPPQNPILSINKLIHSVEEKAESSCPDGHPRG
jgi:hypothetical protein